MKYRRSERFWEAFRALPRDVQEATVKAFELFKSDQRHPGLKIKKMEGYLGVWEGRIGEYRFTFHYETDAQSGELICVFRTIGTHNILRNP
jgi:mRNA-degrading endonuclease RelE of RelBE toxin-antitoxin system